MAGRVMRAAGALATSPCAESPTQSGVTSLCGNKMRTRHGSASKPRVRPQETRVRLAAGRATTRSADSAPGVLRVGCSGWRYAHWRDRFYPADLSVARWLEYYAT